MINCRVAFVGTPAFAVPCLQSLAQLTGIIVVAVITQPDKPIGRHRIVMPPAVKEAAALLSIPVLQPPTIRSAEFLTVFRDLNLDLAVIVAYGKIVPLQLLAVPRHGWVNMHASLLPRYRGASPIQAAVLNGDTETGVTAMQLDAGLDTGPILSQRKVPIGSVETANSLHDKLAAISAQLLTEILPPYLAGSVQPHAQPTGNYTTTKPVQSSDGRIDWQRSADYIERQIRAYNPTPGTYCSWGSRRLKILYATVAATTGQDSAGQVHYENSHLTVRCGRGTLEVQSLQLEGKKSLQPAQFIAGYPKFSNAQLS
ncbi:MAG: methionyl-tRNA formyltransferase [Patescibacteria group bacterium]